MPMPVDVIRSRKRKKTVHASVVDGRIRVHVPAWMNKADEEEHVAHLVDRLEKRYSSGHIDLARRAATLAKKHDLPLPASITWSDIQRQRWGSCSIDSQAIRISSRLAPWPDWVLDYVIIHELAHLVEANHSPAFHALVDRYRLAERAQGFLIAKSYDDSADPDRTDVWAEAGPAGSASAPAPAAGPPAPSGVIALGPVSPRPDPRRRQRRRPADQGALFDA